MGVCTKRSALLALDRIDSSSSWSPLATTHQHVNLDFFASLTHLWIEILCALIPRIWNHVNGIIVWSIVISLWNLYLLGPLLAYCLKSVVIDIRIYISMDPLNWWCYFWADDGMWPDVPKLITWFWPCPVCCCTCCTDGPGLYCIWFAVVPWVCLDEPWTVWTSPLLAGAAS